jgi:hypothetical protein
LFDVTNDPSETKDLAKAQPEKVKQMQAILAELQKDDVTKLPADLKPEGDFKEGNE